MFTVFYKHCVIFDMDLFEEDWYEIYLFPQFERLRYLFIVIEAFGFGYYYYSLIKLRSLGLV